MKNLVRYIILAAISSVALFAFNKFVPDKNLGMLGWVLIGMFTTIYAGAHFYITAGEEGRPGKFVSRFMAATTLRLLFFMIFIATWAFTHRPQAVVFIFHFLALYLLYTVVEVSAFYRRFSSRT